MGSTLVARRAGNQAAMRVTAAMIRIVTTKVRGSMKLGRRVDLTGGSAGGEEVDGHSESDIRLRGEK